MWRQLGKQAFWAAMMAMPTSWATAVTFRLKLGRWPRRREPMSFNDRLHAGKLHWRDPLMTRMVDKVLVKAYVAEILGPEWVTPTLYAGPALPPRAERNWPRPYVIKANHASGTNYFVRTAADEDWNKIERLVSGWLRTGLHPRRGEWPYLDVAPQVLVEPMITTDGSLPVDYKVYTFSGRAVFVQGFPERHVEKSNAFFDRDWQPQNFSRGYRLASDVTRPDSLDAMFDAAERLSQGLPFVRVDFYEVDGRPRFGEMTFFPSSGYVHFRPRGKDDELGRLWLEYQQSGAAAPVHHSQHERVA